MIVGPHLRHRPSLRDRLHAILPAALRCAANFALLADTSGLHNDLLGPRRPISFAAISLLRFFDRHFKGRDLLMPARISASAIETESTRFKPRELRALGR